MTSIPRYAGRRNQNVINYELNGTRAVYTNRRRFYVVETPAIAATTQVRIIELVGHFGGESI